MKHCLKNALKDDLIETFITGPLPVESQNIHIRLFPALLTLSFLCWSCFQFGCIELSQCLQNKDCEQLSICLKHRCVCRSGSCERQSLAKEPGTARVDAGEKDGVKPEQTVHNERQEKVPEKKPPPEPTREKKGEPAKERAPDKGPPLGRRCNLWSAENECGPGFQCIGINSGYCYQDCEGLPFSCQENQDGRTLCLKVWSSGTQRYICARYGDPGDRCEGPEAQGRMRGCDHTQNIYCETRTGLCESGTLATKEGQLCGYYDSATDKAVLCDYKNHKLICNANRECEKEK